MRFDIMTLFPQMVENMLGESILGRAQKEGFFEAYCHDIRAFSKDKHRRVDDTPYGGGGGMIMGPEPIYDCFTHICEEIGMRPRVIYMSPQGRRLNQKIARELLEFENITLLCGRYEGIDERIIEEIVDEEISLGDFVLTGGEIPAAALIDCVARMIPGVLAQEESYIKESHYAGLLEYPQYTRPPIFMGREVPDILSSGHHANIERWRHGESLRRTYLKRPDILESMELGREDEKFLEALRKEL